MVNVVEYKEVFNIWYINDGGIFIWNDIGVIINFGGIDWWDEVINKIVLV